MSIKIKVGKAVWKKVRHNSIAYDIAESYQKRQKEKEYNNVKPKLKALRNYYRKCDFPELVKDTQWRQYRFLLWNGEGKKVKDQVRDHRSLRRACVKYAPKAVYCTTSTWLDPVKVGKREEYKKAHYRVGNNIMIYHDLIFDIDNEDLEESRKITLELIEFMEKQGYTVKTIIFSGGKGFHVWFDEDERPEIADPREREYYYMGQRKAILSKVVQAGIKVDPVVTSNTRCIVRVPGTVHWKTGYVASYISKEQLQKPMSEILKEIPRAWPEGSFQKMSGLGSKVWGQIVENPDYWKLYKGYSSYFISNKVPGTKDRYVLFLRFKHIWLNGVVSRLNRIKRKYNLSDIYLFGSDINHRYFAVCLKTMQPRRIVKIIKDSDSANMEVLYKKKFKTSFFRMGEKISEEDGVLAPGLKYIRTIGANPGVNERSFVSGPHLEFFNKYFFKRKNKTYENVHGCGELHSWLFNIEKGKLKERLRVSNEDVLKKDILKKKI